MTGPLDQPAERGELCGGCMAAMQSIAFAFGISGAHSALVANTASMHNR